MLYLAFKFILSALIVVSVSEIAKRNALVGSAVSSFPFVSILAMLWIWHETRSAPVITKFSWGVCWLMLPSMSVFVFLPLLMNRFRLNFHLALALSCAAMLVIYYFTMWGLKKSGVSV
jgi:hypothetical protein